VRACAVCGEGAPGHLPRSRKRARPDCKPFANGRYERERRMSEDAKFALGF
jgi:hypothetical protein